MASPATAPRHLLDEEIDSILSLGIEAHTNVTVGRDISVEELQKEYDCLYIAIGAHQDKKVGIPGEDSRHVLSAVEMLRAIGDDVMPTSPASGWWSSAAATWPWT